MKNKPKKEEHKVGNRIFWAGDSTVKTNKITTYPQTGIGQALYLYLKDEYEVCNFAENGRSTKSFMDEGRLDAIDKRIGKEDFFFIQFGHNDEKIEDKARYTDIPAYQSNLKKYVDVARKQEAYPVLITPLYRRCFGEDGSLKPQIHLGYPEACKQVAGDLDVPLIDLCESSRLLIQEAGDIQSQKWFMHIPANTYSTYPEGLTDNTHLQYSGAVVMAGLIADGLRKLGGRYSELLLESIMNVTKTNIL
ncbi:MAG: rhamnogalacturonan acetylesterase [Anaerocolumna sp.]